MNKFIKYTYEYGEMIIVRRSSITSFRPTRMLANNTWRVFIIHEGQSDAIFDAPTCEDCWKWIDEQIDLLEKEAR